MRLGAEREGSLERQVGVWARPHGQAGCVPLWPDLALLAPCLVWLDHRTSEAGHLTYSVTPRASLTGDGCPRDSTPKMTGGSYGSEDVELALTLGVEGTTDKLWGLRVAGR